MQVDRTFFTLYHIPFIPFLRKARISCPICCREIKKNKFFKELASKINPAEAKFQFKSILKSARTPFHAIAASYLAATLVIGVMTYTYYEDLKHQNQVKAYQQNPTDNVLLIAKNNDSAYPYTIIYIPEIHEEEAIVFDWKYNYENFSDAKHALELAINSVSNKRIKTNFSEPYTIASKDISQIEYMYAHTFDKRIDWRPFFSDQK